MIPTFFPLFFLHSFRSLSFLLSFLLFSSSSSITNNTLFIKEGEMEGKGKKENQADLEGSVMHIAP